MLEPTDDDKSQNQNAGDSKVIGIEFFTQAHIYDKFDFYLNYTFLDPSIMLENENEWVRVGDMAKHHLNFGLNKEFDINEHSVNLNFRGNLVGEKLTGEGTSVVTNPLTHIDPYTVYHAVVSYTTPESAHRLSVQLIVNNIFNADYYHPGVRLAGNGNYAASLPQNRRNIHLKLIYGFRTR
jgi:outer membrane receptor for ferrienterochelin and colicins